VTVAKGPDGRWIVDPLDGTIAFVAGLPTFGVSIALKRGGRLEVGVMLFPRLRELFVAERGQGAWLNGRRIRVSRTTEMARCVVSLWHEAALWRDRRMRERMARMGADVRSVAMVGARRLGRGLLEAEPVRVAIDGQIRPCVGDLRLSPGFPGGNRSRSSAGTPSSSQITITSSG
jgi:fructose-1,6-bisphosphatase/inositol monophosphatase family enzyme